MDLDRCLSYVPALFVSGAGLSSQQWGQKRSAAKAVESMAEEGAAALAKHVSTLATVLLQVQPC